MEIRVSGGHTPNHVASVFEGYEVGGTCVTFSTVTNCMCLYLMGFWFLKVASMSQQGCEGDQEPIGKSDVIFIEKKCRIGAGL